MIEGEGMVVSSYKMVSDYCSHAWMGPGLHKPGHVWTTFKFTTHVTTHCSGSYCQPGQSSGYLGTNLMQIVDS